MKQLLTEIRTRQIEYQNSTSYNINNNILPISGKIVLTDPKYVNSGTLLLPKNQTTHSIIRSYSCSYVTIISKTNSPFHLKIIMDADLNSLNEDYVKLAFGITTSIFSYANPNLPIIVAVANGTLGIDPNNGSLLSYPTSTDQEVEFVIASYDSTSSTTEADFGVYSHISGGQF
jgi:hypothetical protein